MRRVVAALILSLIALVVVPLPAYGCSSSGAIFNAEATSCPKSIGWRYDPAAKAFSKGVFREPGAEPSQWDYELSDRCTVENNCGASAFTCPPLNSQPGRMYIAVAFRLANGLRDGFTRIANVCAYPGIAVPLVAVEAAVREEIQKRIPQPSVTSAPPGQSVVNFFTIFSTQPSPEQAITFTNPVPGEVRAVPEYSWDFGDGIKGMGPGTAFNPAVLPSRNPGYYLGATYAKPGTKHVTLTVTWRVTFRLEGVIDVPLAPIVMTATEDKPIATARAVLVR